MTTHETIIRRVLNVLNLECRHERGLLQARTLAIVHEGHEGLVRTKQLLKETLWFPGIDRQAEVLLKGCLACQATTPTGTAYQQPLKISEHPTGPWLHVCRFLGSSG